MAENLMRCLWLLELLRDVLFQRCLFNGKCNCKTPLTGKTAIVTGASSGIGYETALNFAQRGARVILACRNKKTAEEACARIIEETRNKDVVVKILDLASFASVRKFAKDIKACEHRLDVLVNNAALLGSRDLKSKDGHNLIFQINYLSPFLLTHLLIGLIKKSPTSRVINVSSKAAKLARFNFHNFDEIDEYPILTYASSKLCNILFTIELAKRLKGCEVSAYSAHPGMINSGLLRKCFLYHLFKPGVSFFLKTCEEGAQTTIHLAVARGIEGDSGEHFEDCKKINRYSNASKSADAEKLWRTSEVAVKLAPDEMLWA